MKEDVCSWTLVERNMLGMGAGEGERGRLEDMVGAFYGGLGFDVRMVVVVVVD
jgi:hypothetical protein